MSDLAWMIEAKKHIGTREIHGGKHNPKIVEWFQEVGASWFDNDEVAWCGAFLSHCLKVANRALPKPAWKSVQALAWSKMGMTKLDKPAYGAIVVFSRKGGGHVGFVVGKVGNQIQVLGGNQGDAVSIKRFGTANVVGYYWASHADGERGYPSVERYDLASADDSGAGLKVT